MTAQVPVVHNAAANTHEPLPGADTLSLTAAQVTDLRAQLGLPDDNQAASEVSVSPAILGETNVQDALAAAAASITGLPATITAAIAAQVPAIIDSQVPQMLEERRHPLDMEWSVATRSSRLSSWLCGMVWREETDELYRVEIVGAGHTMEEGARLELRISGDGGSTWGPGIHLWASDTDTYIRAGSIDKMDGTRIGGVVTIGPDGSRKQFFFWTDDWFETVNMEDRSASMTLPQHFVYDRPQRLPAAAGGHDTQGFFWSSYGWDGAVKAIGTSDNGATLFDWTVKTNAGLPGGASAQEPSFAQTPEGWVCAVRLSNAGECHVTTAPPDMSAWSAWSTTGIRLGSNPVMLIPEGDRLHFYANYRSGFAGSERPNSIVHWDVPSSLAFSAPATIAAQPHSIAVTLPTRATGYGQWTRMTGGSGDSDGDYVIALKAGESSSTSYGDGAMLVIGRQRAAARFDDAFVAEQILEDPTFRHAPRGTEFIGVTTDQGLLGRMRGTPSGATMDVRRVPIPEHVRACMPFNTDFGVEISVTSGSDYAGVAWRWRGDDARPMAHKLQDRQDIYFTLFGWGPFPLLLRGAIVADDAVIAAQSMGWSQFSAPKMIDGLGAWTTTARITTSRLVDKGLDPEQINLAYVGLDCYTNTSPWDLRLAGAFVHLGLPTGDPVPPPLHISAAAVERYCRVFGEGTSKACGEGNARSTTSIWQPLLYSPMAVEPTIALSAVGDFMLRSGADLTPSAMAPASVTKQSARLVWTVAGATTGHGYFVETASGAPATAFLRADTGD